ncbi:ABC transporter substrate-binding protein [Natroniella sp. ANB-PHB2]|uniref:ABC transporter substrate-binding protein n=1 Tax=Natroniella sp. ANB-PHB2 TaxID=3384444 RepID=UPI0038D4EFAC
MSLTKKNLVVGLVGLVLVLMVVGCSQEVTNDIDGELEVGIIQIVEHPALDASREGFIEYLNENGYREGEEIVYDYQNAQGDMSNAQTIANQFVNNQVDMILAIATPTSQAVANATTEIPTLITAVTDPQEAGLVKDLEQPGTNVTGTSDLTPVQDQLELLKEISPEVKDVGILYNAGETNSVVQAEIAREVTKELGLNLVEATVSESSDVLQATESLIGRVDALYAPTDNTVASAVQAIVRVANQENLPFIVGEKGMVEGGALATTGIDYYKLGRQTGEMAIEVIEGADPAQMPIEYLEETELIINQEAVENINIDIPQEIINQAVEILNEE